MKRERKPSVKAFYNRRIEEVNGVKGVFLGPDFTTVICSVADDLKAVSEPLKNSRYKAFSFGFGASEYFERSNSKDGWRLAAVVCTPTGHKINSNSYMGEDKVRRFTKLSHYTEVTAKFYMKGEEPVTEWEVTTVSFDWETRKDHSIEVVEDVLTLSMPLELRKRYTVFATTEPLPKRTDLTAKIQQWLGGRKDIPAEVKDQFMRLADAMSVAYLNAWGSCEELMAKPQPEIKAEPTPIKTEANTKAPATEAKTPEIETPAPVSEETEEEPETTAMAAVGGGTAVITDPDPQGIASAQAALGSEAKKASTRRKGTSKGGTKRGK